MSLAPFRYCRHSAKGAEARLCFAWTHRVLEFIPIQAPLNWKPWNHCGAGHPALNWAHQSPHCQSELWQTWNFKELGTPKLGPAPPNRDQWDTQDREPSSNYRRETATLPYWKHWDPHLPRTPPASSAKCHLLKQTHRAPQGGCRYPLPYLQVQDSG